MKLLVIYRPLSEHGSAVDSLCEFSRNPSVRVELLDIDTREGMATASLYDIMQYPGILALRDDGSVLNAWQGTMLPLAERCGRTRLALSCLFCFSVSAP